MNPHQDIEDLIARHFDGSITETEFSLLQATLKDDPAALDLFMDYSMSHHTLAEIHHDPYKRVGVQTHRARGGRRIMRYSALAAAACLALLLAGMWTLKAPPIEHQTSLHFREKSIWHYESQHESADGGRDNRNTGQLTQGRVLHLEEGVLLARLPSKVLAIIEGPAVIRLENDNTLKLDKGRGWFSVPAAAKGFSVITGRYRVVDLGTEFGVYERPDLHQTEVHVFKGAVAISDLKGKPIHSLQADQALAFNLLGEKGNIDVNPDDFLDNLPTQVDVLLADDFESPPLADNTAEPFQTPTGWSRVGTKAGSVGTFNPAPTKQWYSNPGFGDNESRGGAIGAMKGPNLVYIYKTAPGNGMSHGLGNITKGSTYSVSLAVGHRPIPGPNGESIDFGGYTVSLMSGATVLASTTSDTPPGEQNSVEYVHLHWKTSELPENVRLNSPLSLHITTSRANSYLDIDNVRVVRTGLR